jgi:DNA-directed RNA polymerase subunit RPC12/RpoP
MTDTKTYTCAVCGGTFEYQLDGTWSESDAKKEYERLFPDSKWENKIIVCDDCWKGLDINEPQYKES